MTTTKLRAYHNKPRLKLDLIAQLEAHARSASWISMRDRLLALLREATA